MLTLPVPRSSTPLSERSSLESVTAALAGTVEEKTLHMVTADPFRTPTFTLFGDANYLIFAGAPNCVSPCVTIPARGPSSFAWSHGGIQDEIASTWVGYVGPGIQHMGDVSDVWTDHTDLRPTILTLLGLADDYETDGRAVVELLDDWAIPHSLIAHRETFVRLGAIYKQLNAPFGRFGMDTAVGRSLCLRGHDLHRANPVQLSRCRIRQSFITCPQFTPTQRSHREVDRIVGGGTLKFCG